MTLTTFAALALAQQVAVGVDGQALVTYPRVVIGCWQITERNKDEEAAVNTLRAYVDAGFNTFDTADIYGASEAILGKLRERITDPLSIQIHTKYVTHDATLANAKLVNMQSRRALGVTPELVQFHWWDYSDERYLDAAQHLVTLRNEGLLREVAACNFDTAHLKALVEAGVPLVSNQVQYSLLDRRPENGMLQYARAHGLKLAVFGCVAGGWLSDAYLGAPPPEHTRPKRAPSTISLRMYRTPLERWAGDDWALFQELLRTLRKVGDRHGGMSIANVAVMWVLHQLGPDGGWVILGVRDTRHLEDHKQLRLAAARGVALLDEADIREIAAVLAKGQPPKGDIWGHERGYV